MNNTVSLTDLNAMGADEARELIGGVYEHSPWIAEQALKRRPFPSVDALHEAMCEVVAEADEADQLALLRAHPELGPARARERAMTSESAREQSGAGLDSMESGLQEEFDQLNRDYREKFGFPFIIAVGNYTFNEIVAAFRARIGGTPETERAEALRQINAIARIRLDGILGKNHDGDD